ncbi:DNA methyltransferase, partial [Rothia sp. HMSC058E10]|uniref:DNA methyltransferase n=1 Tax=Rothia sp. HMSC058E10 TaxID=1715088 RepID=UPI001AEF889A
MSATPVVVHVARLHLPIAPDAETALPEYAARRSTIRRVLPSGERVSPHLRHPRTTNPCIHFDTVCDPACGSGNFLQVAYMQLRELETRVLTEIHRLEESGGFTLDASLSTRLSISQFHG